ncbi:ABC transporter permease [Rhizobium rhizogenes]|uniref:ABC transporter permease n=1 Tax=Rhizobium rhizogenes TaxID=359 RepID=UPI001574927C|nr:ABC transporter permease [Rhizobium rhizogenes]NTI78530.1 ABC transporter permease [Rhizobium rhizogenes]
MLRTGVIIAFTLAIELLCLTKVITPFTMPAPHKIVADLFQILVSGKLNGAILRTLANAAIACISAIAVGVAVGALIHPLPWIRRMLDPVFSTYYAVPVLAFYPIFVVVFGLGDTPQILTGFMLGFVTVIINTLDGLDRVPPVMKKVARIEGLGQVRTAFTVALPFAIPYIATGAKLAVSYSIVGVIAAEFIMSRSGIGYEIHFAYLNFDNATMYPMILLLIVVAVVINMLVYRYERKLLQRRGLVQ